MGMSEQNSGQLDLLLEGQSVEQIRGSLAGDVACIFAHTCVYLCGHVYWGGIRKAREQVLFFHWLRLLLINSYHL